MDRAPGTLGALSVNLEKGLTRTSMINVRMTVPLKGEMRHRLGLLVPHLQRAVTIGKLFEQSKTTARALTETLDHVEAAVFLVDAKARIVFANDTAKKMLGEGSLVRKTGKTLRAVALDRQSHTGKDISFCRKRRRLGRRPRFGGPADGQITGTVVCPCPAAEVRTAGASR